MMQEMKYGTFHIYYNGNDKRLITIEHTKPDKNTVQDLDFGIDELMDLYHLLGQFVAFFREDK